MQRTVASTFSQFGTQIWNAPSNFINHSLSSYPRVFESYYSAVPMPIRRLIDIPVTIAKTIQQNIFPSILFTEGYHVFRQNFGFLPERLIPGLLVTGLIYLQTPENMIRDLFLGGVLIAFSSQSREMMKNNFLLYGMALTIASKIYVNPWFSEKQVEVESIWHKLHDQTISHDEYYGMFYDSIWNFTEALFTLVTTQVLNSYLASLLKEITTFKEKCNFARVTSSDYSIYGINANSKSSGTEEDNEKAYLNLVQLYDDIEKRNGLIPLWNSRISTIIDFYTACRTLFSGSPVLKLSFYFFEIALPRFLVLSIVYSFFLNTLLGLFEKTEQRVHRILSQLKDLIISQISNIDHNAKEIAFLHGDKYEAEKLLNLFDKQHAKSLEHDSLESGRSFITNFAKNFEWLFPILACIKDVRNGIIQQGEVGSYMNYFSLINAFLTWVKTNFEQLDDIMQSVRRLFLFDEKREDWTLKRVEIKKKLIDSTVISFSGSIFAGENDETLLARGTFTLKPSTITHFDAPSGSGKTTLQQIFLGVSNYKDLTGNDGGTCSLPIKTTIFLPSNVYILGPDEPIFQMITYPGNHKDFTDKLQLVKGWLEALNLPPHIYDDLIEASPSPIKKARFMASLSSDGERRRLAFCNFLLKLATQKVDFFFIDEFLKGVDFPTQKIMVGLLLSVISENNSKCAGLYTNHEQNHGLSTHTLTIDKETREFQYTATSVIVI